jgi:hypothetical protein
MKKLFNKIAKQFSKGNELRFVWWNLIFQTFFAYSGVKYGGLRFDDIFVVIFFLPITCGLCWFMGKVIEDY